MAVWETAVDFSNVFIDLVVISFSARVQVTVEIIHPIMINKALFAYVLVNWPMTKLSAPTEFCTYGIFGRNCHILLGLIAKPNSPLLPNQSHTQTSYPITYLIVKTNCCLRHLQFTSSSCTCHVTGNPRNRARHKNTVTVCRLRLVVCQLYYWCGWQRLLFLLLYSNVFKSHLDCTVEVLTHAYKLRHVLTANEMCRRWGIGSSATSKQL